METAEDLPIYPIHTGAALAGVPARRIRSWEGENRVAPSRAQPGRTSAVLDSGDAVRALRLGIHKTQRLDASRQAGFTFVELLVGLTLFAGAAVFLLQAFMNGMTYANRSDERAAATNIAMQVMEQVKASPNPYSMVGFTNIVRTPLPLPAPYNGIANPSPHKFQASVTVTQDNNLIMSTVTVNVYRPSDPDASPLVTLSTLLDAQ